MYAIRPLPRNARPEHNFRIYLSQASLLFLRLHGGDLCSLKKDDCKSHYALAYVSSEKIQDTVVQTSKILQDIYGFTLRDKVSISLADEKLETAATVTLIDVTENAPALTDQDVLLWQGISELVVPVQHEALAVTQKIAVEVVSGVSRDFKVLALSNVSHFAKITPRTKILISRASSDDSATVTIPSHTLGGLDIQIEQVQQTLWLVTRRTRITPPESYHPPQGIIIYGAKGTGKTLLIDCIAASDWKKVFRWSPGQASPSIASLDQPCLVIVEGVQASPDRGSSMSISSTRDLFDTIKGLQVLVITECRHPNDLPEPLRAAGIFEEEIELPIPTEKERLQILQVIRGQTSEQVLPDDQWLRDAASRTHGYVGGDLRRLYDTVTKLAICPHGPLNRSEKPTPLTEYPISVLNKALTLIRPSALQEVFLETPNVRWSDIGGQHDLKRKLQQAIEWPLKQAERMKKLNLRAKKGILLYGPPGCSKTLLVKALATEADLNFLAVKGAELISMYVGESERAVREVFRKARAASPSIIFFDEIDSIASARGGPAARSELNVLTTLLNEMDGFEELRGVFVVAATNKPQAIDPALMRPGRLDNVVYVGPPDLDTRTDILRSWAAKSNTDADMDDVARQTDGFSGAELIGICQTAGEFAMHADRDCISAEDFARAVRETPRGITKSMLSEFESWNAQLFA